METGMKIKVVINNDLSFKAKLNEKNSEGIIIEDEYETFLCEKKKTEIVKRILFIPWNSISFIEILGSTN